MCRGQGEANPTGRNGDYGEDKAIFVDRRDPKRAGDHRESRETALSTVPVVARQGMGHQSGSGGRG